MIIPIIVTAATVAAAIAAVFAALYTKRSAEAAAQASKAASVSAQVAQEQVELQRPRPIVVAAFSRSWSQDLPASYPGCRDRNILLENVGDSVAFDIEISEMSVPGSATKISTEKVLFLRPGQKQQSQHRIEPPASALRQQYDGDLAIFLDELRAYFDRRQLANWDDVHRIEFILSYRALDERKFSYRYSLAFSFPRFMGWVEVDSSLLQPVHTQS